MRGTEAKNVADGVLDVWMAEGESLAMTKQARGCQAVWIDE